MKKSFKTFLILFLIGFIIGPSHVLATLDAGQTSTIQAGDKLIYSGREDVTIETVEGVTYDSTNKKLTLENAHIVNLVISSATVTIELKGNNVIDNYIFVGCAFITFKGDGTLIIGENGYKENLASIYTNGEEISNPLNVAPRVKFDMTGTITAFKGVGGMTDDYLAQKEGITNYSSLMLGNGVKIVEGGEIKSSGATTFIGNADTTTSNYKEVKVVIQGTKASTTSPVNQEVPATKPNKDKNEGNKDKEKNESKPEKEIHTITTGTTSFASFDEAIDPDYSLDVEDKKSSLSEKEISEIEKTIKDSHLILYYNISVLNAKGSVVAMKNGNYAIRLKLSKNDLKNYDKFTAIYVDKNGEVKETFEPEIDGEYLVFTTSHLSNYGVLGVKTEEAKKEETKKESNNTKIIIISIAGVVLVGGAVTTILVRKKLAKNKKQK